MHRLVAMALALASALPAASAVPGSGPRAPVPTSSLRSWTADFAISLDSLQNQNIVRPVNLALTVSTEGKAIGCAVERSSGAAALDQQACALFLRRGQFEPALDSAGKPAVGVFRVLAAWGRPGQKMPPIPLVDMVVEVKQMPQRLADPAYVDIAVSVEESGKVSSCALSRSQDWAGLPDAARVAAGRVLGRTACDQAVREMTLASAKDAEGRLVKSVQTALVLFTAQAAALAANAGQAKEDAEAIVVTGKAETKIPYRGSDPIVDFQPAGREVVLLQARSGKWYRATLVAPCIGSSALIKMIPGGSVIEMEPNLLDLMPRDIRSALERQTGLVKRLPDDLFMQEGLAFPTHADGTFDRNSTIIASVVDPFDVVQVRRCRMSSLVESDPPAKRRSRSGSRSR